MVGGIQRGQQCNTKDSGCRKTTKKKKKKEAVNLPLDGLWYNGLLTPSGKSYWYRHILLLTGV